MKKTHVFAEPVRIEKNIPVPTPIHRGRPNRYPWKGMEIGDSFLFPKEVSLAGCRTMAWDAGRKLKRKFTVMQTSEGNRCWRIELPELKKEIEHHGDGRQGV